MKKTLTFFSDIFNCIPPSPLSNGYINSYNRTAEGLTINFACTNRITCICPDEMEAVQNVILHTAVCILDGCWEPNLEDFCSCQRNKFIMITLKTCCIKIAFHDQKDQHFQFYRLQYY